MKSSDYNEHYYNNESRKLNKIYKQLVTVQAEIGLKLRLLR